MFYQTCVDTKQQLVATQLLACTNPVPDVYLTESGDPFGLFTEVREGNQIVLDIDELPGPSYFYQGTQ